MIWRTVPEIALKSSSRTTRRLHIKQVGGSALLAMDKLNRYFPPPVMQPYIPRLQLRMIIPQLHGWILCAVLKRRIRAAYWMKAQRESF